MLLLARCERIAAASNTGVPLVQLRTTGSQVVSSIKGGFATLSIDVDVRFSTEDPFAITMTFHTNEGPIEWVFDREMLDIVLGGYSSGQPHGDVRLFPTSSDMITLRLGRHSDVTVLFRRHCLARFKDQMSDELPLNGAQARFGTFDWDSLLREQ
jgi:hypothetical protein